MKRFFKQFIPFIIIGIVIVALAFGILLLSYLLLFGVMMGLILFFINWVRNKFFPPKKPIIVKKKSGRIIDSDDWKKL